MVNSFDRIVELSWLSNVNAERDRMMMGVNNDIERKKKDELHIMTKPE